MLVEVLKWGLIVGGLFLALYWTYWVGFKQEDEPLDVDVD